MTEAKPVRTLSMTPPSPDGRVWASFATRPDASRGRRIREPESPTRSPFQRDRDRVIHAGAFRRLQYKTQVFVYHEGDYFRTRLTHSLEVAQIARSISRFLGLEEDLAEAVALAHDLGHTPFGHAGEDALGECLAAFGGFDHNDQSLRIVTRLERRYAGFDGLNLTWEAVEGLVKHNGPLVPPRPGRTLPQTIAAVDAEWPLDLAAQPSAEAQVAALSDDIAYNNHDIDDGLRAGLFTLDDLIELPLVGPVARDVLDAHPGLELSRLVHEIVRRMIDAMVTDLLTETRARIAADGIETADDVRAAGRAVVAFSETMRDHDRRLRTFLRQRMYRHYKVNRMTSKARRVVKDLYGLFTAEPECLPPDWQARVAAQGGEAGRARVVADYIAGMTDRFALAEHGRLFVMNSPDLRA
jgi:dGTPase